jgi:tetratricopeptide (TPR) repeat protein
MHAVDEFLVILENDPENFKVYKELADIYISVENSEAAVETYEKALEIYPDHTETMKELAELYIELQNYDKAESLLEKALSYEADDIAGLISIARVKVFLGKNDEAIEKINRIFEKEPDNIEALGILADYYTSSGQYEKALLQTEKIRKKLPNSSFGYRKTSEICEKAGMIYEMHYYYGIFHNLKGEKQLAIDEFSHALDLNPNNTDIMLKIAELYEELTEPYIAIEYYERIFNIDNSSISSLKKAGELYFRQKNYEKASACFEIVLESDKSDKELYFKLAQAQENYKDREKAFENYKKFIKLAPLSPKTDEAKSKIEKLESKLYGEDDEGFLEKIFKFFTK